MSATFALDAHAWLPTTEAGTEAEWIPGGTVVGCHESDSRVANLWGVVAWIRTHRIKPQPFDVRPRQRLYGRNHYPHRPRLARFLILHAPRALHLPGTCALGWAEKQLAGLGIDLLGADPDFVFAGWNYGFSEESGITLDSLAEYGIATYALNESCRRVVDCLPPGSREDWYDDVRNIAAIFGVPERAKELIDE